jgi:hypothetical protein
VEDRLPGIKKKEKVDIIEKSYNSYIYMNEVI